MYILISPLFWISFPSRSPQSRAPVLWHPTPVLLLETPMDRGAWWAAVHGVARSQTRLSDFTFTFHFHALEKEMATHSSVLPGESQGRRSLVGCRLWGRTESDMTEVTQQLYSRFSLVLYFIHSISHVNMSIPISQFIPPPLSVLSAHMFVLYICVYFCFVNKIIYAIF